MLEAQEKWEKTMFQIACDISLEESEKALRSVENGRKKIAEFLEPLGLERLDVPAD